MTNKYWDGATIQIWREGKLFAEKHVAFAAEAPKYVKPFIRSNLPYLSNKEWQCFIVVKQK